MGCRWWVWRGDLERLHPCVDLLVTPDRIMEIVGMSDYVVVAVPNTQQTRGMIGESLLRQMKETAYLIDVSGRAVLYDYSALVRAMEERWIAGVCLQPSGYQPDLGMPPADARFWQLDGVVLTPCRTTSREMAEYGPALVVENLR